jgi:hypothetical protein
MVPQAQISSTVIASSGQTETQDSQPRHSLGFATLVLSSAASNTSAGQTSTHSPHDLHFSVSIFGKYINSPHQILVRMRQTEWHLPFRDSTISQYFASIIKLVKLFAQCEQWPLAGIFQRLFKENLQVIFKPSSSFRQFLLPIHLLFFHFQNVSL